jgi:hypothetical protein
MMKVITTGVKVITTGVKVITTGVKVITTGVKVVATMPVPVVIALVRVIDNPEVLRRYPGSRLPNHGMLEAMVTGHAHGVLAGAFVVHVCKKRLARRQVSHLNHSHRSLLSFYDVIVSPLQLRHRK